MSFENKNNDFLITFDNVIPYFQPIVNKNKIIHKYESLARIKKSNENNLFYPPMCFLPKINKTDEYLKFTKIMINKTINIILKKNINLSVNLTNYDLINKDMRKFILEKINLLPDKTKLTIEIVETENIIEDEVITFLKKIQLMGVLIYIDDYGTGYSNLELLTKLRPDGIKIDGLFIKNIINNKYHQKILKNTIRLMKYFKIDIIVEYVENKEIFEYLIKEYPDIKYFQGYFFGKPDIIHHEYNQLE